MPNCAFLLLFDIAASLLSYLCVAVSHDRLFDDLSATLSSGLDCCVFLLVLDSILFQIARWLAVLSLSYLSTLLSS